MTTLLFGMVLPWLLIAAGLWLGYQLAQQNGRMLVRLEAIEKRLASRPANDAGESHGLAVGTLAPDFELPDLAGASRKLSEFRGQDVLLVLFNPKCGFCTKMAADLAALSPHGADGRALPIVVTTGDAEENRKLVKQHDIRCVVLVQKQMEVAAQYGAQGTPMGYRLDREGRIASELAVGAEPLLKLADLKHAPQPAVSAKQNGKVHNGKGKHPDPSLARSKLNRSGLKAGPSRPTSGCRA